jgi:glyceraldehyde-3-phosphate dehydrogenase/erythrose-4-phosphate dehydrogenase
MGFGRIGRNLFRILYNSDEFRVAAISDVADHR